MKETYLREHKVQSEILDDDNDESVDTKTEDIEKFNALYNEIVDYFEREKPYCNPDFCISQLSLALDSNVKYISKAIKINKDVNFNVFVNIYRINMTKDMLAHDFQDKYTIRYIYTSAGFRHQSTFNKAFKQIEGITPSEYIKINQLD